MGHASLLYSSLVIRYTQQEVFLMDACGLDVIQATGDMMACTQERALMGPHIIEIKIERYDK